jgi:hypothetical protein
MRVWKGDIDVVRLGGFDEVAHERGVGFEPLLAAQVPPIIDLPCAVGDHLCDGGGQPAGQQWRHGGGGDVGVAEERGGLQEADQGGLVVLC